MLMEFDEQEQRGEEEAEEMEEDEEEEMELPLPAAIYDKLGSSSRTKMTSSGFEPPASAAGIVVHQPTRTKPRYRECLKNHAVGLGGHAVDGCGEFMAAGADGTLDSLKCAACHCHRNFHRKETAEAPTLGTGELFFHGQPPHTHHHHHQLPQFPPYCRTPAGYLHVAAPQQRPLALPSTTSRGGQWREEQEDVSNPSGGGGTGAFGGLGSGGGGGSSSTKRLRTKFTQEQKERMLGLAETLGWRIQKHDEAVVQQFCSETGVKRHVLKVWMHNNKHTLGKKPQD